MEFLGAVNNGFKLDPLLKAFCRPELRFKEDATAQCCRRLARTSFIAAEIGTPGGSGGVSEEHKSS